MFNMTPIHFNTTFVAFSHRTIIKMWCESKLRNNSTRTWTPWYNNKVTKYILLSLLLNDIGIMFDLTIYMTIGIWTHAIKRVMRLQLILENLLQLRNWWYSDVYYDLFFFLLLWILHAVEDWAQLFRTTCITTLL